jgi:hypothetical protein
MSNYNIAFKMSKYDDGKSLFLSPKVTQYDGHMVMSNVVKPTKIKYVNIDTGFQDDFAAYDPSAVASCTITLPERITEVKSIKVRNIEIPMSMYNISAAIGNHCFQIANGASTAMVVIPDGQYTITGLVTAINAQIGTLGLSNLVLSVEALSNKADFRLNTNGSMTINFAVSSNGAPDSYNFKRKLGWILGFRKPSYVIGTSPTISEGIVDVSVIRYLYLVLDEFTRGNQNSFIAALPSSLVRKTILARVSINKTTYPFGSVLPANNYNGYLLTDTREYTGRVDLQKLSIQLVDDIGAPVSLNGLHFSFCLEVEHE